MFKKSWKSVAVLFVAVALFFSSIAVNKAEATGTKKNGTSTFYLKSTDVGTWKVQSDPWANTKSTNGGTYALRIPPMKVMTYKYGTTPTFEVQLWQRTAAIFPDKHIKSWTLKPSATSWHRVSATLTGHPDVYVKFVGNFRANPEKIVIEHLD